MKNDRIALVALALGLLVFGCLSGAQGADRSASAPRVSMEEAGPKDIALARLLDSLHVDAKRVWFWVDKSERVFRVMVDSTELKRFVCVLGEHPEGDKRIQGDRRTPEGTFTFRSKRRPHQWHVFIWIDYPNAESWRRFKERQSRGEIPADADIGGEVGIHGVPEGKDHWITAGEDWTWGCIALKNADVDEIYPYIVPWKTKLVVEP